MNTPKKIKEYRPKEDGKKKKKKRKRKKKTKTKKDENNNLKKN